MVLLRPRPPTRPETRERSLCHTARPQQTNPGHSTRELPHDPAQLSAFLPVTLLGINAPTAEHSFDERFTGSHSDEKIPYLAQTPSFFSPNRAQTLNRLSQQ